MHMAGQQGVITYFTIVGRMIFKCFLHHAKYPVEFYIDHGILEDAYLGKGLVTDGRCRTSLPKS